MDRLVLMMRSCCRYFSPMPSTWTEMHQSHYTHHSLSLPTRTLSTMQCINWRLYLRFICQERWDIHCPRSESGKAIQIQNEPLTLPRRPHYQETKGQRDVQKRGRQCKSQKNNTADSNVVPHRTTNTARSCLTSLSRREAVLSCLYGRSCLLPPHCRTRPPTILPLLLVKYAPSLVLLHLCQVCIRR